MEHQKEVIDGVSNSVIFNATVFFEGEYLKNNVSWGQSFYRTLIAVHNQSAE